MCGLWDCQFRGKLSQHIERTGRTAVFCRTDTIDGQSEDPRLQRHSLSFFFFLFMHQSFATPAMVVILLPYAPYVGRRETKEVILLLPRLPKGRGIAGTLIFLSVKPAYMPCTAGEFFLSNPTDSPCTTKTVQSVTSLV